MSTNKIDLDKFVDVYLETNNATQAYKEAGAQTKYLSQGAANYLRKPEVKAAIEDKQIAVLSRVKNTTLHALEEFMGSAYHELSAKDKGTFLTKMMEKTGLDAPKRVQVTDDTEPLDIPALASQMADAIRGNPVFAGQFAKVIGGDAGEGREPSPDDVRASTSDGKEPALAVHSVREAEDIPSDGGGEEV